jgi:hypothetical protein
MSDLTDPPVRRPEDKPEKAGNGRVAVAAVVGGLAALFAVINFDDVEVNWLVGSWQTPADPRDRPVDAAGRGARPPAGPPRAQAQAG